MEWEKECVTRLKILERIESDHLPLEFEFRRAEGREKANNNKNTNENEEKTSGGSEWNRNKQTKMG